ncbi:MAG: Lrp/AsnC family transcriptional regulator [Oscillospiraceae bacterium]|nr:Lrp/AsnC family transcriptional regulator [Oscillospiraceae bacterium]
MRRLFGKTKTENSDVKISGLDEIDNQIADLLLKDGRMPFSDIGEKVGLSRVAVKNRIRAMESKGIIQGYKAVIEPQSAPGTATFILHVETAAGAFEQAKEYLTNSPEVVTLVQTTGECHLLAVCVAPDVSTMRNFVNTVYKDVPNIRRITAHSVLDIIKGSITPDI